MDLESQMFWDILWVTLQLYGMLITSLALTAFVSAFNSLFLAEQDIMGDQCEYSEYHAPAAASLELDSAAMMLDCTWMFSLIMVLLALFYFI